MDNRRFFRILSITLISVGSFGGLCFLLALRGLCKLSNSMEFKTTGELLRNTQLLPRYVKVIGNVFFTNPANTPIAGAQNYLSYHSWITYNYDKRELVRRGESSFVYETNNHSIEIRSIYGRVDEFELLDNEDNRVKVILDGAVTLACTDNKQFYHIEERGRQDSSFCTLTCPDNPNFQLRVNRSLPIPYSKSSFEFNEEWKDFDRVSVWGVANKESSGVITIEPGGLNNRMVIAEGAGEEQERAGLCGFVVFLLLTVLSLPPGIYFLNNPDAVELPWFPNDPEH